jgi:hypothetical protein
MATADCRTITWHLRSSVAHRLACVGDRSVESGGDALANSRPLKVIRSQLMDWSGPGSHSGGKVRVEGWRLHDGENSMDKRDSGSAISESESPGQRTGGSHEKPFVERH